MDNDVSAGSTTSTSVLGHLALGLTLLAFGIGQTRAIDGVVAATSLPLALYLGGGTLFLAGLLALRTGDTPTGTAFAGFGAFWFIWAISSGDLVSSNAAGLFIVLWALLAFSLTLGAGGAGRLFQGAYGLFTVALLLIAIGLFGESTVFFKVAGWVAAVAGLASWYGATAALAHWPTEVPRRLLPRRAADRGVTATG
ncbi:GPR1/FUN34/YaaH family transporter [Streptomyces paludis]|uniref:Uncharacterized protein n=1 Tax=Streptomyces paludis TaxID=2282738 RepID=A0A345HMS4_9ACTN|nr:GPR1/FUN34/YaaH family transporter [Streptomyces paludis]AXG77998.1 hypothetical protein DVK44_10070 [Streptomyces paludis]